MHRFKSSPTLTNVMVPGGVFGKTFSRPPPLLTGLLHILRSLHLPHLLAYGRPSKRDLLALSAAVATDKVMSRLWRRRTTVTPVKS